LKLLVFEIRATNHNYCISQLNPSLTRTPAALAGHSSRAAADLAVCRPPPSAGATSSMRVAAQLPAGGLADRRVRPTLPAYAPLRPTVARGEEEEKEILIVFEKMLINIFMKNVGGNVSKKYLIQFSLTKYWCNSFKKVLVQLFMKNVGSNFC
jgi:hypothetical protein